MSTNKNYYILMADILESSDYEGKELMNNFQHLIEKVNEIYSKSILSPLTITLGDEFQSVISDLESAIQIIIALEENRCDFKLRYVLWYGEIETAINTKIAFGMLGPGLTNARAELSELKSHDTRFYFGLKNQDINRLLDNLFILFQDYRSIWEKKKDWILARDFIELKDYKEVAEKQQKVRSLMWKREKTLKMKEYQAIKELITSIAKQ